MMINEFGTRRRYDDRYENLDGWSRNGHARRFAGDWMREPAWLRGEASWGVHPYGGGQQPWGFGREQLGWGREPYAWGQPWGYGREPYGWGGQPYAWGREPTWLRQEPGYEPMVKVLEVVAESPHSWEDATRRAIAEASQSVRGIRSIHVEEMQAVADEDHVLSFRIHAKIAYTRR
jgi:flavin-binding protein dodecin